MLKGKSRCQ